MERHSINIHTNFHFWKNEGYDCLHAKYLQSVCMDQCADEKEDFELKEVLGKYSIETLASCAFGVDAQSFSNDNSQFVANAKSMFDQTIYDMLKFVLAMIPGGKLLLRSLDFSISPSRNVMFFYEVVTATLNIEKKLLKGEMTSLT